jgi:hypothetical protein
MRLVLLLDVWISLKQLIFLFIVIIHRTIRRKFEIFRSQLKERLINKCMYMYKVLITRKEL